MELNRQLGLLTSTALVIGEVIAIGIFLTPAGMAKSLASPGLTISIWIVMGTMALCGALCYAELAAKYPEAGGGYVYLREAYGRPFAFLYGWMSLLVMDPGITAALAVGLGSYISYLFHLSPVGIKVVAITSILLLACVNIRGVRFGAGIVRWLTIVKLGFLAFLLLWGFAFGLGNWANFTPFFARQSGSQPLIPALAGGLVAAFFSYGGWWDLNKMAGEVRDPGRTLPKALIYGVTVVTLVYIFTSVVFLYLVPLQKVSSAETFAAQAGEVLFGPLGGEVFCTIVIVAVFGSLAALVITSPRVYFAMARDELFLSQIARVSPQFGTPARAIVVQAILASLLAAIGTFNEIVSYFIFVVVIFIGMTVAAVFKLRRLPSSGSEYRTPGYPVTPAVFLILTMVLLVLLGAGNPKQAVLGVAVVSLGLPVYYLFFRKKPSYTAMEEYTSP